MKVNKEQLKSKSIFVLSVLCTALLVLTVMNSSRIKSLEREKETENQKCLSQLCESLDNITVSLQKSMYTGTEEMLKKNGNDLCREAAVAKVSLSGLTDESIVTDEIYKFLSQAGDYTLYLCRQDKLSLSDEEKETLRKLYSYSRKLSEAFEQIGADYFAGETVFTEKLSTLQELTNGESVSFYDSFTDAQQTMTDYPTLLYDGPFADTVINKEPKALTGREITDQEAAEKAARILGTEPSSLKRETDNFSEIPLYCFSIGDKAAGITKKGGFVCYITDASFAGQATISAEEAVKRGKAFLKEAGFTENMTATYYSSYDGVCTVNYAYENKGIIYYPDLIKVSISLETGKAVAMDSRGYLMNHTKRTLKGASLPVKQCKSSLSDSLSIISHRKAVIPLENGKEALCYEFHCKDSEGQEILVYTDTKTGEEKDILLLLYSDDGVLTK